MSPPHTFVHAMHFLATMTLAYIAFALTSAVICSERSGGSAIVGALVFPVGVWLGQLIWSVGTRQTRRGLIAFVTLAGDRLSRTHRYGRLWLRARVP